MRKTVTGGDTLVIITSKCCYLLCLIMEWSIMKERYKTLLRKLRWILTKKLDDVRLAIDYFQKAGLLQIGDDGSAEMLQVPMLIGQRNKLE